MTPADAAELKRTIQQLEQAYYANESQIEPSMKETYRKSLASLNDEIRECEVSMDQNPEDAVARSYLSTAYAQKAQLLQSALEFDLR
jgi:phosphoenolpyruvate carboxylase